MTHINDRSRLAELERLQGTWVWDETLQSELERLKSRVDRHAQQLEIERRDRIQALRQKLGIPEGVTPQWDYVPIELGGRKK